MLEASGLLQKRCEYLAHNAVEHVRQQIVVGLRTQHADVRAPILDPVRMLSRAGLDQIGQRRDPPPTSLAQRALPQSLPGERPGDEPAEETESAVAEDVRGDTARAVRRIEDVRLHPAAGESIRSNLREVDGNLLRDASGLDAASSVVGEPDHPIAGVDVQPPRLDRHGELLRDVAQDDVALCQLCERPREGGVRDGLTAPFDHERRLGAIQRRLEDGRDQTRNETGRYEQGRPGSPR
jgi:hypothetical protein